MAQQGFFDKVKDVPFKTGPTGETLFFPWGMLGVGYIVDSQNKRDQIGDFYKNVYLKIIPLMIITIVIQLFMSVFLGRVGLSIFCVLYVAYVGWIVINVKKLIRDLQKSTIKLTLSESFSNSVKPYNWMTLIFLEIISLDFIALGIFSIRMGQNKIIGLSLIVVFAFCSIAVAYWIVKKITHH